MIKPEIAKLPRAVVDRIPLVIYIPPPPDEPSKGPITVPDAIHTYPPKHEPPKKPSRRFAFLRRSKKHGKSDERTEKPGKSPVAEPLTWEDHWEQGDYPFVRLEGNRAACAICLMDFEEPKRAAGASSTVSKASEKMAEIGDKEEAELVQEIPIRTQLDEDEAKLRLTDAGVGAQPLRLLTCGHVFHVSPSSSSLGCISLSPSTANMFGSLADRRFWTVSGVSTAGRST